MNGQLLMGRTVAVIVLLGFAVVPALNAQQASCAWDLSADFRTFPNQENPSRDCCGNPGVWHYLESDPAIFPAHLPSTYRLLPEFIQDAFFTSGLEQWQGSVTSSSAKDKLPAVGMNTGAGRVVAGIGWPSRAVRVHPLYNKLVIVGWRSPMTASVRVTGSVADMDAGGGDGISWFIDHFNGATNITVASGSIANGGSQNFQNGQGGGGLAGIPVKPGEFLYFVVDPKGANHAFDSTALSIVIARTSNACTAGPCDDCDPCTRDDACVNGVCTGTPYACDDGNVCTTDACDGAGGCTFVDNSLACDDGDACTRSDACSGGVCRGIPACDDHNDCTADACDPGVGCRFDPIAGASCNDGNACTVGDACAVDPGGAASCRPGAPRSCDDGTACTSDSCNVALGCVHNPVNCDDQDVCTLDSCDAAIGCVHVNTTVHRAPGRVITVDDDGPAEFRSIQAALNDSRTAPGDVVSVAAGTYFENVVMKCGVSLVGEGYETTVIDGGRNGGVARIVDCCSDTLMEGLKLTNGSVYGADGGGLLIQGGEPVIRRNMIVGNSAVASVSYGYYYCSGYGGNCGGVLVQGGAAVLTRNVITGNIASTGCTYSYTGIGGGLCALDTNAVFSENLIRDNGSSVEGGGIFVSGSSSKPRITGNEITNNSSPGGGGIDVAQASPLVTNNLLLGNTANFGGGLSVFGSLQARIINNTIVGNRAATGGGAAIQYSGGVEFDNNVVYGNTEGSGLYVRQGARVANNIFHLNSPQACTGLDGAMCSASDNIMGDPLMVDPAGGDYRLGAASPAIDSGLAAGAPADDHRGQRRPLDGNFDGVAAVDRGAWEYDRNDVTGLRFLSDTLLIWDALTRATSYNVYSGPLATLMSRGLDTCRIGEDADRTDQAFIESNVPTAGTGVGYIVTAIVDGMEGSPGWNSQGIERSQPIHCP